MKSPMMIHPMTSIITSDGCAETFCSIFKAVSFFGASSSAGKTYGGLVSVGVEPSTDAFSEELLEELGAEFSIDCDVTKAFFTVDVVESDNDDEVEATSSDFCSSESGIPFADKSTVNRKFIKFYFFTLSF